MATRPGLMPILAFLHDEGFDILNVNTIYHKNFFPLYLIGSAEETDLAEMCAEIRSAFPAPQDSEKTIKAGTNKAAVAKASAINKDRKSDWYALVEGESVLLFDLSRLYSKVRAYQDTAVPFRTFKSLAERMKFRPGSMNNNISQSSILGNASYLVWQNKIETYLSQLLEFVINEVPRRERVTRAHMEEIIPTTVAEAEEMFLRTLDRKTNISFRALCKLVSAFYQRQKCVTADNLKQIFQDDDTLDFIRILYVAYMMDVNLSEGY
jgi:hypothetical protein